MKQYVILYKDLWESPIDGFEPNPNDPRDPVDQAIEWFEGKVRYSYFDDYHLYVKVNINNDKNTSSST